MSKAPFFAALTIAMALVGAGCASSGTTTTASTPTGAASAQAGDIETEGGLVDSAIVSVSAYGFNPKSITVKKGDIVTWLNEDPGGDHWPASNPHPAHTDYPGFDAGAPLVPGQSWTFKFDRVGTWGYHDHLHPETAGTVVVTE